MSDERIKRALARLEVPDEGGAESRAWQLTCSAFADREHDRQRRRPAAGALLATATVAVVVAVAASPAGPAFAGWIRDNIGRDRVIERVIPEGTLIGLPGPGKMLVTSAGAAWLMRGDGSKRNLGRYPEISWSPRGLFAVAWRNNELVALDPNSKGEIRWTLTRPDPVDDARWAPSGFRVAYREGTALRVVWGDGTNDGLVQARVAPVAAAWRPATGTQHVLAFPDIHGRVRVIDTDSGRDVAAPWRCCPAAQGLRPLALAWTSDGASLAVITASSLLVRNIETGQTGRLELFSPGAGATRAEQVHVAARPNSSELALNVRAADGRQRLLLVNAEDLRALRVRDLNGPTGTSGITWSPDGETLLVNWPRADQWLFLRPERPDAIDAAIGIAQQFDPSATTAASPAIAGWCCVVYP